MAEPLQKEYPVYPEPAAEPGARLPGFETRPELPPGNNINPRLNNAAEAVGSVLGTAANAVDDVKQRFTVIRGKAGEAASEKAEELAHKADELRNVAGQKVNEIRAAAGEKASQLLEAADARVTTWADAASHKAAEIKHAAAERAAALKETADQELARVKTRAESYAQDYPFHVIVGAFAGAFVFGVLLRIWRSGRGD